MAVRRPIFSPATPPESRRPCFRRPMSQNHSPSNGPSPAERLAAIDERQQRLLSELDLLNQRIEAAITMFGGAPQAAASGCAD